MGSGAMSLTVIDRRPYTARTDMRELHAARFRSDLFREALAQGGQVRGTCCRPNEASAHLRSTWEGWEGSRFFERISVP